MKPLESAMPMDRVRLRAWWWCRQGLDGSLAGKDPAAIRDASGWARSVAGAGPYLGLFARGGIGRAEVDAAVARLDIHELPAARGCTYVVPAADYALALTVGRRFEAAEMKTALKLGVTVTEIDALCECVLAALADGPLDPEGIRARTGNAARGLGEAGKKKGLTTTLPLAVGRLQAEGAIRRVANNGRLDQQRYLYARWDDNPLGAASLGDDEAFDMLARRFFRWIGPARLAEFQWFSGLGAATCRAIAAELGLVPAVSDEDFLLLPEDVEAFAAFRPPDRPDYALVSSLDTLFAARRNLDCLLDDTDERRLTMEAGVRDLPNHAILDRGHLIGLWEYDPAVPEIAWVCFADRNDALATAVHKIEAYVRDQLGDARAYSLDSPKSRVPRIEALRRSGG
jgi:hypothetical protein